MSNHDAAREGARQANGEFGVQPIADMSAAVGDLPEAPAPDAAAERIRTSLDELHEANPHHSGSMLPHEKASDCRKCHEDEVHNEILDSIQVLDTSVLDSPTYVAAVIAEMKADNEADYHSGSMMPHGSASDCRKCLRKWALRDVEEKLTAPAPAP